MSDRRVHVAITCLNCNVASQGYHDVCTAEVLGASFMRNNRRKTFEAASIISISIAVNRCEACSEKALDDGK